MTKNDTVPPIRIDSGMKKKWEEDAEKENRSLPNYIRNAVESYRKNKSRRFGEKWIDYENLERLGLIKKRE